MESRRIFPQAESVEALTAILALIDTTPPGVNIGARVTYAMGRDELS
jgi:hypothetical protein